MMPIWKALPAGNFVFSLYSQLLLETTVQNNKTTEKTVVQTIVNSGCNEGTGKAKVFSQLN
jgi:hypothetical protein